MPDEHTPTDEHEDEPDPSAARIPEPVGTQSTEPVQSSDDDHEDGRSGVGGFLRELPVLILIAFGLALLIKTFLAQAFYIPSESMLPTLHVRDRVLVNKLVYRFREPRRGEIIVFVAERDDTSGESFWSRVRSFLTEGLGGPSDERDFIKRVIGLPGETVEVDRRGRVFITPADGGERFRLDEPYIADEIDRDTFGPQVVPDDQYIVMGDNRPNSSDSRKGLGPIDRSDIIGKAFMRIWPPSRIGFFRTPAYEQPAALRRAPPSVSWRAWSPTAVSNPSCAMPGSVASPAWMRPDAGHSPVRWSPVRWSSATMPTCRA